MPGRSGEAPGRVVVAKTAKLDLETPVDSLRLAKLLVAAEAAIHPATAAELVAEAMQLAGTNGRALALVKMTTDGLADRGETFERS